MLKTIESSISDTSRKATTWDIVQEADEAKKVNSDRRCPATALKMEEAEGEGMPVVSKSWGAFHNQKGNSLGPEATQN